MWILWLLPLVAIIWFWPTIRQFILIQRIYRLAKKEDKRLEEEARVEREKISKEEQKRQLKRQIKVLRMKEEGLEQVSGVEDLWIKRTENGKIKELYNLDMKRIPLAELARSPSSETIGWNDVTLIYQGEHIRPYRMMVDEMEIDKLNGK
jgi:hypothetical protein